MELPLVLRARFDDFEAFAASVPGASVAATPLRPGPFSATTTELRLGDVLLNIGCSTPLMAHGAVAPDAACVVLPLGEPDALVLNGRKVGPDYVGVYAPGAEHAGAMPHGSDWALVVLPASAPESLLALPGRSPLRRRGAHAVLRVGRPAWARATALLRTACEVAAEDPEVFEVAEARRALRADVLDTVRELLAGPYEDGSRSRTRRAAPARHRVVRAVEDYLRANPSRPVAVEELCAALGLSPSRLHTAVEATFSVGLERYVRLRRLAMVRTALRSADPRWTSVQGVAAAHGFWDVGSFTKEYSHVFGEVPALRPRRGPE